MKKIIITEEQLNLFEYSLNNPEDRTVLNLVKTLNEYGIRMNPGGGLGNSYYSVNKLPMIIGGKRRYGYLRVSNHPVDVSVWERNSDSIYGVNITLSRSNVFSKHGTTSKIPIQIANYNLFGPSYGGYSGGKMRMLANAIVTMFNRGWNGDVIDGHRPNAIISSNGECRLAPISEMKPLNDREIEVDRKYNNAIRDRNQNIRPKRERFRTNVTDVSAKPQRIMRHRRNRINPDDLNNKGAF